MSQKQRKNNLKIAIIAGICTVIAASIGIIPLILKPEKDDKKNLNSLGIVGDGNTQINGDGNEITINQSTKEIVTKEEAEDFLTFNYSRLFGGYQVPAILENTQGKQAGCSDSYPFLGHYGPEVEGWWEDWEYKDAIPLKSTVWEEMFCLKDLNQIADYRLEFLLLYLANKDDPKFESLFHYDSTHIWNDWDGEYEPVEKGAFMTEWEFLEAPIGPENQNPRGAELKFGDGTQTVWKNSSRIGFLILFIKNEADLPLRDIILRYKEFRPSGGWPAKTTAAELESRMGSLKIEEKHCPILEPNGKLLWLLSVYNKDQNGYPESYISSITTPMEVEYRLQGKKEKITRPIREPLKEKAMKLMVPFGWYGQ